MRGLLIILVVSLFPIQVVAENVPAGSGTTESVKTILKLCEKSPDFCKGYLVGIVDTAEFLPSAKGKYCLPSDWGYAELQSTVLKFLGKPDVDGDLSAPQVIIAGLILSFPCRN